jgi:hypothetical protein
MTKSQTIPIRTNLQSAIDQAEEERAAAMTADFRDYQFCSRLVDGMTERQRRSECIDLVHTNQELIHHIICTRNAVPSTQFEQMLGDEYLWRIQATESASCISSKHPLMQNEEGRDELIFELDI